MAVMRQVRRSGVLLIVLLLVLLLGRGIGLLSTSTDGREEGDREGDRDDGVASAAVLASTWGTEPGAEDPAASSGSAGPPDPLAPQQIAAHPDRTEALVHLARRALAEDRLGACFGSIEALRQIGGGTIVPEDLATAAGQRLQLLLDELQARLQAGEVLQADGILTALLEPAAATTTAAVETFAVARGWPSLLATAGAAVAGWDAQPLARDRAVRFANEGTLRRSRVVAAARDQVTVRIATRDGVLYPSVPAYLVEPDAVTAAEAVELAFAALAAGDWRRAGLWCSCALLRGPPSDPQAAARLEQLRRLLS